MLRSNAENRPRLHAAARGQEVSGTTGHQMLNAFLLSFGLVVSGLAQAASAPDTAAALISPDREWLQ